MGPESTKGKIVGVIFFCLIFVFGLSLSLTHSLSLSLSRSLAVSLSISLSLTLINNYIHAYMCLTVGRQSRDHRPLSRDPSVSFYKKIPNCLKRPKTLFDSRPTVAWPPTTVAWPFSDFFSNFFLIAWNVQKRCLTVGRRSRDLNHCRVTVQRLFFKIFPNRLKTSKKRCLTVVRRSRDLQPLSRDRSATFFPKTFIIAWNVQKTLFDSRPTVAWPPTTVAWPFSDFFNILPNCLKRPKNVVWQSADGRVTSDHCRVTVQRLFSKFSQIAWNVQKTLFDSRPTVGRRSRDLRPLSRDRLATFFQNSNCLKRRKIVVWQSADSPVTSDHCRVTVQRLFSKFSQIARNVQKTLFDSRPTVAWPPTTVAWPFSDFFQKFS